MFRYSLVILFVLTLFALPSRAQLSPGNTVGNSSTTQILVNEDGVSTGSNKFTFTESTGTVYADAITTKDQDTLNAITLLANPSGYACSGAGAVTGNRIALATQGSGDTLWMCNDSNDLHPVGRHLLAKGENVTASTAITLQYDDWDLTYRVVELEFYDLVPTAVGKSVRVKYLDEGTAETNETRYIATTLVEGATTGVSEGTGWRPTGGTSFVDTVASNGASGTMRFVLGASRSLRCWSTAAFEDDTATPLFIGVTTQCSLDGATASVVTHDGFAVDFTGATTFTGKVRLWGISKL